MQRQSRGILGALMPAEDALVMLLGWLLTLLLAGMVVVVSLQVMSRYLLDAALIWSEEVARLLFISLIFVGAAVLARRREHLTVTIFVDLLPERLRHLADALAAVVGLVISYYLVVGGWATFLREWDQRTPALQFPMGLIFGLVLVSTVLLLVWLAFTMTQSLVAFARGDRHWRSIEPHMPEIMPRAPEQEPTSDTQPRDARK